MPTIYDDQDVYDKEKELSTPDGSHDNVDLSDDERSSFDDMADNFYNDSDQEESDAHDEMATKETDGSGPDKSSKKDKEGKEKEERDPKQLYHADNKDDNAKRGPLKGLRNKRKALMLAGAGSLLALIGSIVGTFFMPALELVHIKEVMVQEVGGIQSKVVRTRSGRIFSRGFFFHEGEFDGYKSRGKLTSIYKNYQSQKMFDSLRANGYDFEYNQTNGKLVRISQNGVDLVNSSQSFESIWDKRSALREVIRKENPERSAFWRARKAREAFRRTGLFRRNWIRDNRLVNWAEGKELAARQKLAGKVFSFKEKFRTKLRAAMLNLVPGLDSALKPPTVEGDAGKADANGDGTVDAGEQAAADGNTQTVGELEQAAKDGDKLAAQIADDPTIEIPSNFTDDAIDAGVKNLDETLVAGTKGAVEGGIGGWANLADKTCQAYGFAQAVRGTSRLLRATQLMKYATAIFTVADSVKDGDVDSKDLSGIMSSLHTVNKRTGKGFYNSGTWQYFIGGRKKPSHVGNEKNQVSIAGEAGGTLGDTLDVIDKYAQGSAVCGVASNPIFGIAVGATEIAIKVGGCATIVGCAPSITSTAVEAASAGAIQVALETAKTILTPILARMFAGMVVTGDEKGDKMAAALGAGAGALSQYRGHGMGMRPLKNRQAAALQKEVDGDRRTELAQMSTFDRYLSFGNPTSLATTTLVNSYRQLASLDGLSSLRFPSVSSLFGSILDSATSRAFAEGDPDEIAHDAFGNVIVGMTDEYTKGVDPGENEKWMMDNGYVDASGAPKGEYETFIKDCVTPVDVEYKTSSDPTDTGLNEDCLSEDPKLERMRLYTMDLDISGSTADNASGNVSDTNEPVTGATSTPNTAPVTTGGLASGSRADLQARLFASPLWKPQTVKPTNDIKNGIAKDPLLQLLVAIVEQAKVTISPSVIQTGHDNCSSSGYTSNHYGGNGVDIGNEDVAPQLLPWLYNNRVALGINELIFNKMPVGTSTLKNGENYKYDSGTLGEHGDHIHISVKGPKLLAGCPRD